MIAFALVTIIVTVVAAYFATAADRRYCDRFGTDDVRAWRRELALSEPLINGSDVI